jgi:hypothetical protein
MLQKWQMRFSPVYQKHTWNLSSFLKFPNNQSFYIEINFFWINGKKYCEDSVRFLQHRIPGESPW